MFSEFDDETEGDIFEQPSWEPVDEVGELRKSFVKILEITYDLVEQVYAQAKQVAALEAENMLMRIEIKQIKEKVFGDNVGTGENKP